MESVRKIFSLLKAAMMKMERNLCWGNFVIKICFVNIIDDEEELKKNVSIFKINKKLIFYNSSKLKIKRKDFLAHFFTTPVLMTMTYSVYIQKFLTLSRISLGNQSLYLKYSKKTSKNISMTSIKCDVWRNLKMFDLLKRWETF